MLWLLCKVLFNDTATEGVLYYLSHCSSLQSRHCISTLLFFFYIYKQRVIPEKFLFQLQSSTDPNCVITSPYLGQVLLLQLQRDSASCPGRVQLPFPAAGTHCHRGTHCHHGRHGTQPAGQEGAVVPSRSKIRITGAAAELWQLFSISGSPGGKRSHSSWGHGWSSPLKGHRGNLEP